MNCSYICTFFYAIFIALTITFATALETNRQQTPVGKTNAAAPKSLNPAKNTLTKEYQDRNQRQSVKDMMSNNNENIDYSDIDYGVDSNLENKLDNERWFQDGMKRNSGRVKFVQDNSNQDRQDTLLFNEEDDRDEDDERDIAKDEQVGGENKYTGLKTKPESKKSKSKDQRGNEFKKYDFSFPSVSLDRVNNNNRNNPNIFDLSKSGNTDANEKTAFDSNFFKAKLSTGKDQYGDSFTDLSGCNQCGKKNSDYSHKNANNSFAGEDLSSAYNEDDKDAFSFGFFDKQKKIPGLFDTNELPKSAKSKSDEENWNLWKFSVAKSPGYKKWNPPLFSDQLDKTKNTLSHEADYKLSKVEQDDSEKKKFIPWKWGIFKKRSYKFNPMSVIRLKTSERLMRRGFGANLPSSAYAAMQPDLVMEVMENHQSYPNEAFKDGIAEQPFDTGEEWIVKRDKNINELNDRYKREKEKANAAQVKPSNDKEALDPVETTNDKAKLVKDSNAVGNLKTAALTNVDSKGVESSNYQKLSKALDISKEILKLDKSLKALKENYDNAEKHNIRKRSLEALKSSLMEKFNSEALMKDHKINVNNDDYDLLEDMTGSANNLEALKATPVDSLKSHIRSKRSVKAFTSQQVQDNHSGGTNNENNALSFDPKLSKALSEHIEKIRFDNNIKALKEENLDNLKAHRNKRSVKSLKDPLLEDINIEVLLTDQTSNENYVEINDKPELLKAVDLLEAITDAESNLKAFYGPPEDNFNGHSRSKRSVKDFNDQQIGNTDNEAFFTYERLKEINKQFDHNIEFLKALDVLTEILKSEAFKEAAEDHLEAHKRRKRSISFEAFKNPNTQEKHAINRNDVTKQPEKLKLEQKEVKQTVDQQELSKALNSTLQQQQLKYISDHKNQTNIPRTNSDNQALKGLVTPKAADVKNPKHLAEIPKAFNTSLINLSREKPSAIQTKDKEGTEKSKAVVTSQPKTKFLKPKPRKRRSHKSHRKPKKGKALKPHRKYKHSKAFKHRKLRWKKHKSLHYRPQGKFKRSVGKATRSESSLAKETNFLQDFSKSLYEKAFNLSQRVKTFLYKTKELLSFHNKQQHEKPLNVKENGEALKADSTDLKIHLENSFNDSKPMLNTTFKRRPMGKVLRQNLADLSRFQELIKSFYLSTNNTDFKRRSPRSMNILNDTEKLKVSENISLSALARQNESLKVSQYEKVTEYQNNAGENQSFLHNEIAKAVVKETILGEKSSKDNETSPKASIAMTMENRTNTYTPKDDSCTKAFNSVLKKPSNQKRIDFLEAGDHKNKSFLKENLKRRLSSLNSAKDEEKLQAMTLRPSTSSENFLKEKAFEKTFKPGSNEYNSQLNKGLTKQLDPNEARLKRENCQEVTNTTQTSLTHSRLRRSVENFYQDNQLLANPVVDHRITKRLLNPDLGTLNQTKLAIKSNAHYPLEKKTKYDFTNLYPKDGQFKKLELIPKKEFPKLPYKISNSNSNSNSNNNNFIKSNNNNFIKSNNFGKNNNDYNNNNNYNTNNNNNNYNNNNNNNNNNNKNYLKNKIITDEAKKTNSNSKSKSKSNSNSNELKFQPMVEVLKNRYLNDLKHFNQNYKFHDNSFASKSYPEDRHSKGHGVANGQENANGHGKSKTHANAVGHDNHNNDAKADSNLALNLRQQILNCQAFASLEEFLKSLNITHPPDVNCTDEIEMEINTPETMHETQHETQHETPHETHHETPQETHHETPATEEPIGGEDSVTESDLKETPTTCFVVDDIECTDEAFTLPNDYNSEDYHEQGVEPAKTDSDQAIQDGQDLKLNISIRAKVHGNPLSKDFYGNGSIEMLPGLRGDDRLKRKCADMPTVKPDFIEDSEGINSMASGKLSSEVVQAIFKSVKNEPSMQDLVPYLKEPAQSETTAESNLSAIKNQNNEAEVKQAEDLIRQAMKAISSIVEANSRAQACQPLRPDLQAFYNLILRTRQEQEIERAKRALNRNRYLNKRSDFSQDILLLDPSKIKEKTSTVKKLLREYDSLPEQEQQELSYVRDELLQSLLQLSAEEERRQREPRNWRHLQYRDVSDVEDVLKSSQINYTQEFVKLLKAANFYRETRSEAS